MSIGPCVRRDIGPTAAQYASTAPALFAARLTPQFRALITTRPSDGRAVRLCRVTGIAAFLTAYSDVKAGRNLGRERRSKKVGHLVRVSRRCCEAEGRMGLWLWTRRLRCETLAGLWTSLKHGRF